jgi:hypothetical protein
MLMCALSTLAISHRQFVLSFTRKVRPGNVLPTSRRQSQTSSAGKMPAAHRGL